MKKFIILLMLLTMLLSNQLYAAVGDIGGWQYYKEITPQQNNQYKSFFLDEEIYRHAQVDLSDIRIVNEKDEFVPYYIFNKYLNSTTETLREYETKEILSFMKNNDSYKDFKVVPEVRDVDVMGNQLVFEIKNTNFLKNVSIYGSYDNEKWDYITNDYLYRTDKSEKMVVSLNQSLKYEYYRIVMLKDLDKTVVSEMKLLFNQREENHYNFSKVGKADFKIEIDKEEKQSQIIINNTNHLRISEIRILSEDNFIRNYKVYHSPQGDNSFRLVDTGEIYQVQLENFKDRRTSIPLDQYIASNVIKLMIQDNDNKPINISNIEISYYVDKLVFEGEGSGGYRVLFGNENASRPVYDIINYRKHIEELDQEPVVISSIKQSIADSNDKKEGIAINNQLILNGVLIILSIMLVVIIIKKSGFKDL